jgi:hypothetical protein
MLGYSGVRRDEGIDEAENVCAIQSGTPPVPPQEPFRANDVTPPITIVALASLRIAGFEGRANTATALGAAAGALTFAFSGTLWTYATQFTPYVLTAVFTGLILWTP